MILEFASLTEMFAQKTSDGDIDVAPIINSKYQETAFQRSFNVSACLRVTVTTTLEQSPGHEVDHGASRSCIKMFSRSTGFVIE